MLRGKKIILGVSGSIAAYKAALFIRLLIKEEAEVKVVMTASASDFISPLTLSTLSKNPVYSTFVKDLGPNNSQQTGLWNNHVALGLWADAMIIAPATANTIGKMANGFCDNLLTAVYLSARCPVFVAPAMDLDMYQHPSTLNNLKSLAEYGNVIIDAEHGELASGLVGTGRMAEPEHLLKALSGFFGAKNELAGQKVMITAGPTYEAIDPVRFIGNHSSGKMGYALAENLATKGAHVTLISGPSHQRTQHPDITLIKIKSAEEMYNKCKEYFKEQDISIFAAAVADYTPKTKSAQKIKKKSDNLSIEIVKTKDIALEMGKLKKNGQITVGFALETENGIQNAQSKLKSKNFDMIVLNSLGDKGAGFGHDTNKITIIDENNIKEFELKSKVAVANDIAQAIIDFKDNA